MTGGGLIVKGAYDFSFVRVVDANMVQRAAGTGTVRADGLSEGLYRVESTQPGRREQRIVSVPAGRVVTVDGFDAALAPPLRALEVPETATAVAVASRRPPPPPGWARVLVLVEAAAAELSTVRVRARDDRVLLGNAETEWFTHRQVSVGSADALPGVYALEHEIRGIGRRAAALRLAPDAETQVFLAPEHPVDPLRAIHLRPTGRGYEPDRTAGYARVEATLDGLLSGRPIVPSGLTEYGDAMLTLLAAYTLWAAHGASAPELARLARDVERLLPGSPDAAVLLLLLEDGRENMVPTLDAPPMLGIATEELIRLAETRRAVVQGGSWLERISLRRTSWGAWTRWDLEEHPRALQAAAREQVTEAARRLPGGTLQDIARAVGLPQTLVADLEPSIQAARSRLPRWVVDAKERLVRDIWPAVADSLLWVATSARRGLRAGWNAFLAPPSSVIGTERELSELRLPAAGQAYVDGRLLPLMRATQGQWWRARRLLLACRAVVALSLLAIVAIAVAQQDPDAARAAVIALASCAGVALIARDRLRLDATVQANSATLQRLRTAVMEFARAEEPGKALTRLVGEIESAQDAERHYMPMVTVSSDLPPIGERAHADAELEALRSAMWDMELGEGWQRRLGGWLFSQLKWMEHHAERNRLLHQGFLLVAILGGVTVPALVSLNLAGETATWIPWATFALSLMAVTAVAVDEFFAFGEKWRRHRRIAEFLRHEGWSFVGGIGAYERLNPERAARVLAERIETILRGEVETYMRTVVAESSSPQPPAP